MKYLQRGLEIACGLVFLLSGLGKLPNISGFQDLIIQYGFPILQYFAPCIVLVEIFLGVTLILGFWQKKAATLSLVLVILFTCIYTYGYFKNSISDCGCFGTVLKSTPRITYIRNALLIVVLSFVLCSPKDFSKIIPQWKKRISLTILLPSIFIAGMTFHLNLYKGHKHPFEGKPVTQTPLAKFSSRTAKQELLFFMSTHCPHCLNSIENYIAYNEKKVVDTLLCYMVTEDMHTLPDSMETEFNNFYPDLEYTKVLFDSIPFIEGIPSSFLIIDGTIQSIFIGTLPSPILLSNLISSIPK